MVEINRRFGFCAGIGHFSASRYQRNNCQTQDKPEENAFTCTRSADMIFSFIFCLSNATLRTLSERSGKPRLNFEPWANSKSSRMLTMFRYAVCVHYLNASSAFSESKAEGAGLGAGAGAAGEDSAATPIPPTPMLAGRLWPMPVPMPMPMPPPPCMVFRPPIPIAPIPMPVCNNKVSRKLVHLP